jgi:5-hydroxyisourate hydrolase-like protein (transthyretin family)
MVKEEIIMKSFARCRAVLTAVFTAAALLTVSVPAVYAETGADGAAESHEFTTQFGDVNFDQSVSMTDAIQLQRFLLGNSSELGNWKNADLDENDVIDIFDLAVLKRQILGEKTEAGGTLSIKVVDMMTGEPIESANIYVWAMYDGHGYDVAQWDYDPDDNVVIAGLPRTSQYQYVIDLSCLPVGYGGHSGHWDQQLIFEYDGEEDKELVLRVAADNAEKNVRIDKYDWGQLRIQPNCGVMNITDKDGNPYYPTFRYEELTLPDGEYHVDFKLFDYYEIQLLDPDNEFGKEIRELYPDLEFTDKSSGFDFTVKDGKADRELRFDFAPIDGMSNYLNVRCVDFMTGKPLKGVKLSLIEAPEAYAKTVSEWTTDESGSQSFELKHGGFPAYKVQVDSVPAGYSSCDDQEICWSYVSNYKNEVTLYFVRDTAAQNVTADIFKWEDGALVNDAATFTVWEADLADLANMQKIYENVEAGTAFALPDGSYIAALNGAELREKDLAGIDLFDPNDANALESGVNPEHFMLQTDVIRFTVKDGKPDRDLMFFVRDYDPALDDLIELPEIIEEKLPFTTE